ncbi:MAG: type 1 glutamine amidotransferase domain-containing protein [Promethearchaeota archaeon]
MSNTKKVAILAENMYEDLELWYPYYRMQEAGHRVTLVGSGSAQEFASKHGYPVKPDVDVEKVSAGDFDAVIVPGGFAPDYLRRHPPVVKFVREAHEAGKVVAAICHGPSLLVSAGVLEGKRATSFFAIKDDVVNAGAQWEDADAVVDGNLVTSRTPADLPAFCKAILEKLGD